jgi:hypothetical protein
MAELSILWETTSGTGDSNTTGYSDSLMFEMLRSLLTRTANMGGVSPDYLNKLAVTGTVTPVSIASGAALVYGIPYTNSAAVTVAIPNPSTSTRIDRIVLRASWAARTVRITRIAGTEGGGAPALVQTGGTTWDIPLAQISVTTGGAITVTDQREWLLGVGAGTVSNTTMANMAEGLIKGRATGSGTGVPQDLTKTQTQTLLNVQDGADVTGPTNVGSAINGSMAKPVPVGADKIPLIDTQASNVLKTVTIATLSAAIGIESSIFTPQLKVAGSGTGIVYANQVGTYTKIGDVVFYFIYLNLTSKGAGTGTLTIDGLPYTVASGAGQSYPTPATWNVTNTSFVNMFFELSPGSTSGTLRGIAAASQNLIGSNLAATDFTNTTMLRISGWYKA